MVWIVHSSHALYGNVSMIWNVRPGSPLYWNVSMVWTIQPGSPLYRIVSMIWNLEQDHPLYGNAGMVWIIFSSHPLYGNVSMVGRFTLSIQYVRAWTWFGLYNMVIRYAWTISRFESFNLGVRCKGMWALRLFNQVLCYTELKYGLDRSRMETSWNETFNIFVTTFFAQWTRLYINENFCFYLSKNVRQISKWLTSWQRVFDTGFLNTYKPQVMKSTLFREIFLCLWTNFAEFWWQYAKFNLMNILLVYCFDPCLCFRGNPQFVTFSS